MVFSSDFGNVFIFYSFSKTAWIALIKLIKRLLKLKKTIIRRKGKWMNIFILQCKLWLKLGEQDFFLNFQPFLNILFIIWTALYCTLDLISTFHIVTLWHFCHSQSMLDWFPNAVHLNPLSYCMFWMAIRSVGNTIELCLHIFWLLQHNSI